MNALRRAVFLDRDGVLIRSEVVHGKPLAVKSEDKVCILPGVREACIDLASLGFLLIMVTNQPDVARGKIPRSFVENTNAFLKTELRLTATETCFHDDADKCNCRKPLPGLLIGAARRLSVDLGASFMVGDRWRDIEAGRAAGCRTIFIDCGYEEKLTIIPNHKSKSLHDAVTWIHSLV